MTDTQGWEKALELLEPLDAQLDAALSAGDVQCALRLAFAGASEAARLAAEPLGDLPALHQVYVELMPLPLAAYDDGTLAEQKTYVKLAYQRWQVAEEAAERLAGEWGLSTNWSVDSS